MNVSTPATRHYQRAPITEALVDIRASLPAEISLATLGGMHQHIQADYPLRQDRFALEAAISAGQRLSTSTSHTHLGFAFVSADKRLICQARLDGFTFSQLAPYDRWATLRDEARRLWEIYRSIARPISIDRLAVRYINRFELPPPATDLNAYLRTVPEVAPELPQGLSSYFMQLHIPQDDIQSVLILNQALAPPNGPNIAAIILDIDLFRGDGVPTDEASIWEIFEQLHERKNQVFEASITDRTRRLFE